MKIEYDRDTDSLYIELRSARAISAKEVEPGVIFDFDANGKVIGIDFENATEFTDIEDLPPLPAE